jgi:branched-subunit amino acid aminotransferase/4-amino-4-deoxychorismate lyase
VGRDSIEGKAINGNSIWGVGMKLLVNGILQDDHAKLPYSNSLLRGDGLFETILTIDQKPVALDRHYARLEKSAKQIQITLPARIDIEVGIEKVLANVSGKSRLRLNILADGDWSITLEPVSEGKESVSLMKVNEPKISNGALSGVKSISYGESLLVVRRAIAAGFDDGIFLNENSDVVETALSNLLIITDDGWQTPALSTGCLPGITRELLIKWFDVKESEFDFDYLLSAKAVYVTSSIKLIQRVDKIEDRLFSKNLLGEELIENFKSKLFSNMNP